MKLINYKYGYIFNCSIHGKIIVSQKEWQDVLKYLARVKSDISYPFYKDMVKEDAKNTITTIKGNKLACLRVWATEKVAKKYDLKKYKRGNYMFYIKK